MDEIKQDMLRALQARVASQPTKIDNSRLYAGSPMYFYCDLCGHQTDVLPESYACVPKKHCDPCLELKKEHPQVSEKTLLEMAINMPPVREPLPHERR
jgi:hypothetical protein